MIQEALADWTSVFKGNESEHDARGGLQSAGVKEFNIYSIQVTSHYTVYILH